jgi:hypothetical protein
MKKIFASIAILLSYYGSAQNSTVAYSPSTAIISNPERGFYKHEETHPTGYDALNQATLTSNRVNNHITLILRLFYLDDFVQGPISSAYLANMQSDFAKMRGAGIKAVLRFAYSDDVNNGQMQDATKEQIIAHINQVKPILLANSDVISAVQVGFIGTWGEWYYTDHFGMQPTATDYANRKDVVTALLNALPVAKMVQIRTPTLKKNSFNAQSALSLTQAFTTAAVARIGHHNDCFLASANDEGTFDEDNITQEYAYLQQETKYLPMGGETCAVNAPRSLCGTAIDEMEKFHWTYANLDYHPGVLADWQSGGCFTEMESRLGYRFQLVNGVYPQTATINGVMPIVLKIQNNGFASPFNQRTPYLVFRNTATNAEYSVAINSDPRLWGAGTLTTITENIAIPGNITAGSYKLYLKIPDADTALSTRPEYSIQLANTGTWESNTGYNNLLHTVNITSSLGIGDSNELRNELTVYPVPTNDHLVMELEGIEDYKVSVYNSLGQRISLPTNAESSNRMTLDTQTLSNGVYFVSLENGTKKETKRIIVSH